jgi:hypothetical protein
MVRHVLRATPAGQPMLILESFAFDTGEAWSEPLPWEVLDDPDCNPFIQRAAVELLAAVEHDFGNPRGAVIPQSAKVVPGRVCQEERSAETEHAIEQGRLVSCMIRSHLGDRARDQAGCCISYLVAVRMILPQPQDEPEGMGGQEDAPPAASGRLGTAEPAVQASLESSYAGEDPSSQAPGDALLPRFRVLVSRLTPGSSAASGFSGGGDAIAPSRQLLRRIHDFPASFAKPFEYQAHLTPGFRPEAGSRFPVSCEGDGLLTADIGDGHRRGAAGSGGLSWQAGSLGPGGVDLDTLFRTLPYSRVCDRRLNLALESVEATRFKASEDTNAANTTGRERVRQMQDNWSGYLLDRESASAGFVMRSKRVDASTGATY